MSCGLLPRSGIGLFVDCGLLPRSGDWIVRVVDCCREAARKKMGCGLLPRSGIVGLFVDCGLLPRSRRRYRLFVAIPPMINYGLLGPSNDYLFAFLR